MAKNVSKNSITIVGVKPSTIALFEGVLASVIGLVVAILFALRTTITMTQETNNVLAGMTFGLSAGIVSIIVVPLVYFAIAWLVGYFHGLVFNAIVGETEGIVLYTDNK